MIHVMNDAQLIITPVVRKLRKETSNRVKNYFHRKEKIQTERMRINAKSNKRLLICFRLANLSTSLRPKESHKVYLLAIGAFLSYFLPRRLKRELDRAGEDKKKCYTGRSIKCSNAVQAKSNGNS